MLIYVLLIYVLLIYYCLFIIAYMHFSMQIITWPPKSNYLIILRTHDTFPTTFFLENCSCGRYFWLFSSFWGPFHLIASAFLLQNHSCGRCFWLFPVFWGPFHLIASAFLLNNRSCGRCFWRSSVLLGQLSKNLLSAALQQQKFPPTTSPTAKISSSP